LKEGNSQRSELKMGRENQRKQLVLYSVSGIKEKDLVRRMSVEATPNTVTASADTGTGYPEKLLMPPP